VALPRLALPVLLSCLVCGLVAVACQGDPSAVTGADQGPEGPETDVPLLDGQALDAPTADPAVTVEADGTATVPTAPGVPEGVEPAYGTVDTSVEQWVLMYYTGYSAEIAPVDRIDWSSMTHVVFGAVGVGADGSVGLQPYVKGGAVTARTVADEARANGVVPVLMVGGQGAGEGIASAVETDLDGFVADLLVAVDELGYDGLDFNWEDGIDLLPGDDVSARKARFRARTVEVLQALRRERPDLVLTYPTLTLNPNYHPDYDPAFLPKVAELVDRIGIMSYGWGGVALGGGWGSGFSSPLDGEGIGEVPYAISIEQTLTTYTEAGVPPEQLLMGIGSYSLCYGGGVTGPRQPTAAPDGDHAPPKRPLADMFATDGLLATYPETRVWDEEAQQAYLALPEGADTEAHCGYPSRYVSYDDEESLEAKGHWSRTNGYGGTIVWEYADLLLPADAAGGRPVTALLDALESGFLD
jgi:chitinase